MALKINAVVAQAKTLQSLARALKLAEVMRVALHHFLRQAAELAQDVKLQLPRHPGQLGRAGRIENDLKLHDATLGFKVQSSKFKICRVTQNGWADSSRDLIPRNGVTARRRQNNKRNGPHFAVCLALPSKNNVRTETLKAFDASQFKLIAAK
jgi:hypothetical protein